MHVSLGADLVVDVFDDIAGNREAQAFAAPRLGKNKCVDAHHAPFGIDQRTAAMSGVDGSVGLDVDHEIFGLDLPGYRTDDAHAHRALQPARIAEGHHKL